MDEKYIKNLIIQIARNNVGALDELYNVTVGKLFAVSFGILKDRYLAEDVLQEVYLTVAKKAHKIANYANCMGAMVVITKNISLNHIKKRKRRREVSYNSAVEYGKQVEDYGARQDVAAAIKQLPPPQPEIIRLKYYSDLSIREIAEVTKIPKSTVQREMSKAEKMLRSLLAAYFK